MADVFTVPAADHAEVGAILAELERGPPRPPGQARTSWICAR